MNESGIWHVNKVCRSTISLYQCTVLAFCEQIASTKFGTFLACFRSYKLRCAMLSVSVSIMRLSTVYIIWYYTVLFFRNKNNNIKLIAIIQFYPLGFFFCNGQCSTDTISMCYYLTNFATNKYRVNKLIWVFSNILCKMYECRNILDPTMMSFVTTKYVSRPDVRI